MLAMLDALEADVAEEAQVQEDISLEIESETLSTAIDEVEVIDTQETGTDELAAQEETIETAVEEITSVEKISKEVSLMPDKEHILEETQASDIIGNVITAESTNIEEETAVINEPKQPETGTQMIAPKAEADEKTTPSTDLTQQAIAEMETAITLKQEVEEIAAQIQETAKQTASVAVLATEEVQKAAEQTQQALEQTFAAAEKAFETVQNAGLELDLEQVPLLDDTALQTKLSELQKRNAALRQKNEALKARLASLK
jgi:hypothetical protein